VDINYKDGSYLFLAQEETAHLLEQNIAVQREASVMVNRFNFS
jgi:phosphoribosylaminoimidazole carboxylase (NCAIR synthetase)